MKDRKIANSAKVAILLATYNGEKFLDKQLQSFSQQTHKAWKVWASDDGSKDATLTKLIQYQQEWGEEKLTIFAGPQLGFVQNFLALVNNQLIQADYYAYSDQDDIWFRDKLERGVDQLKNVPLSTPALYGSRTCLIDEKDHVIGYSYCFKQPPSFRNALIESIAGGNTMVFNEATRQLLRQLVIKAVVSHDWLTYQLVSGVKGQVYYDRQPTIYYRQHQNNIIGSNKSIHGIIERVKALFKGKFKEKNDLNIKALQTIIHLLDPSCQTLLNRFAQAKKSFFLPRLYWFYQLHLYRQTRFGQLGFMLAILFNKV